LPKIESYALGREREFDVPGSEAPERYMRFLRTGEVEGILPVLDHHRSDILSLPSVMVAADKVFRGLKHRAEHDAVRLSLILKALGRPGWERGLRDAAAEGDAEAARILIKLLKKEGRWDEALESVEASPESIESLIEAARILERRKRDFSQALALSRRALDFSPKASEAEAIGKRIARLERRIGSR
jgi:tetratricopeptide (TPR) repeat protein